MSLALASCARTPAPPVVTVPDPAPAPAPAAAPVDVRVLDGGEEPRVPLRYRIAAGQTESLVMEVATELKLAIGDLGPPVKRPTVRVSMEVTAREVQPALLLEGKVVKFDFREDPTIAPAVVAAVRSALDGLPGTTWRAVFNDRGVPERIDLPLPPDANTDLVAILDGLRDSIRLLLPPLPEPPVGKNARWQLRRRAPVGWFAVEETTTFRLGAFADGHRPLLLLLELASGEQTVNDPGMLPGATATLTSFEGKGSGRIELELEKIVQPSTIGWAGSGKGTGRTAGEPPAPLTVTVESSIHVQRR